MKIPTVSIIIPAFNQEKYIGRCIRSALNQSYPESEYEIIVVNDASADRTRYALGLFKDEIRIIDNPERVGLPGSLNIGIRNARGRFVVRIDADDYVHSEYINVLSLYLSLNDWMDAVACDYQLVDDQETVLAVKNCMKDPIGCGIMFRIEHLIELGMYDEKLLWREDRDLRIRFLKEHNIHRIALPLYRYRRHENNMTNDAEAMTRYEAMVEEKHSSDADIS